jgi:outer membrane protein insertion porin family
MRVQITVVALLSAVGIAVMLVDAKNLEALADSEPFTQDAASEIVTPEPTIHIESI